MNYIRGISHGLCFELSKKKSVENTYGGVPSSVKWTVLAHLES